MTVLKIMLCITDMQFYKGNTNTNNTRVLFFMIKSLKECFVRLKEHFYYTSTKMIEYIATFFSVLSRFIFVYLLLINKSKNTISLMFSLTSIVSGSFWLAIFIEGKNTLLILRTSVELTTSIFSAVYITKNKLAIQKQINPLV